MRNSLAVLMLLIWAWPALAENVKTPFPGGGARPDTPPDTNPPHAPEGSVAGEHHSEAARRDKVAYVGGEYGLGLLFPAAGFEAGYFMTPEVTVGLNYLQSSVKVGTASVKISLMAVRLNYYFGNSLYVGFGAARRAIDFAFTLDQAMPSSPSDSGYKVAASVANIGADIGIGNRWQWSNVWFGIEWLGYFAPVTKSGATEVLAPAGSAPKDVQDAQKNFDAIAKTGNPQLLRVALGVAF